MIDNATIATILGTIIGSLITTIGSIIVASIQTRKEGTEPPRGFFVPANYVARHPKRYPIYWLVAFLFIGAVLSVIAVYIFKLNTPPQSPTSNLLALETLQFDYGDSPINHGWKVAEGDSQGISFKSISDNKVGRALEISAPIENFYAIDYELNPITAEFGNYLEFVSKFDDERTSFYAYINMMRDDGKTQNGWLKFKIGKSEPVLYEKTTGEQEWVIYVTPVLFPNTSWMKMQIDLRKAIQDTYGIDGWTFKKLLKFRFRGNLSLDYITIYEGNQR